jgi:hypothetical protein
VEFAGGFGLVADREHTQVEISARHRPGDRIADAQSEQGAADRRQDRDLAGAAVGVARIDQGDFALSLPLDDRSARWSSW